MTPRGGSEAAERHRAGGSRHRGTGSVADPGLSCRGAGGMKLLYGFKGTPNSTKKATKSFRT